MIWLNTHCDNSEGNQCVCPKCRCIREIGENGMLPKHLPDKWLEEFIKWETRMDEAKANMKKRFPNE